MHQVEKEIEEVICIDFHCFSVNGSTGVPQCHIFVMINWWRAPLKDFISVTDTWKYMMIKKDKEVS